MTCYHPLKGYRAKSVNPSGKRGIVFNRKDGYSDLPVEVPCGQCIGCRLERSRQWAVRCVHEAQLYEDNCFITLTYDNEHLPDDLSVNVRDFQLFMKRLRKRFPGKKIRFFHCGEYGETCRCCDNQEFNCTCSEYTAGPGRPHYHACLFNIDFEDKVLFREKNGVKLYTSEVLQSLWPYGYTTVGDVTFDSAAYVARYITKKITGDQADAHYQKINVRTGEICTLKPEYTTMSRRPGIGKAWWDLYKHDVYPDDFIAINGKEVKPPKYYENLLEIENPEEYARLKAEKLKAAKRDKENNTWERLRVRKIVKLASIQSLKRSIEV